MSAPAQIAVEITSVDMNDGARPFYFANGVLCEINFEGFDRYIRADLVTGWRCPRCNVIHAPTVARCDCEGV